MRKHRQSGFTLIEVIVVIFIIGLVTTLILLRTSGVRSTRDIALFAETFYAFIQVCQQQAILQPAVIGVTIQGDTYQAFYWANDLQGEHWEPLAKRDSFWAARIIPRDIRLDMATNSSPQIVIDTTGGMNAFELNFSYVGETPRFRLISSTAGLLTLQGVK